MSSIVAQKGDKLDQIVFNHYGSVVQIDTVLLNNPHLTNTPLLQGGEEIYLPTLNTTKKSVEVKALW